MLFFTVNEVLCGKNVTNRFWVGMRFPLGILQRAKEIPSERTSRQGKWSNCHVWDAAIGT